MEKREYMTASARIKFGRTVGWLQARIRAALNEPGSTKQGKMNAMR
jgi:hypothetical protein